MGTDFSLVSKDLRSPHIVLFECSPLPSPHLGGNGSSPSPLTFLFRCFPPLKRMTNTTFPLFFFFSGRRGRTGRPGERARFGSSPFPLRLRSLPPLRVQPGGHSTGDGLSVPFFFRRKTSSGLFFLLTFESSPPRLIFPRFCPGPAPPAEHRRFYKRMIFLFLFSTPIGVLFNLIQKFIFFGVGRGRPSFTEVFFPTSVLGFPFSE